VVKEKGPFVYFLRTRDGRTKQWKSSLTSGGKANTWPTHGVKGGRKTFLFSSEGWGGWIGRAGKEILGFP